MKVAVIGAGLTGLSVASVLHARGVDVSVFEKSRGRGGRMSTKRLPWADLDIGAQYFTARAHVFIERVDEWQSLGLVAPWNFTPHAYKQSVLKPSPDQTKRFVALPGMNSLCKHLSKGLDIHFNARVESLTSDGLNWSLTFADGSRKGEFDWVVACLPAEQSKQILANTAVSALIPRDAHEPCWALALATSGYVDPELQGIFGDDEVAWVSRLNARPDRNKPEGFDDLWMLHFSGHWSRANAKLSQDDSKENRELSAYVLKSGHEWLNKATTWYRASELELVHSYSHFWRYAKIAKSSSTPSLILDEARHIAALGDWNHGGRVEGAFLSAQKYLDYFFERY